MRYAPVSGFAVSLVRGSAGTVAEGWAAPAGGSLPCGLKLAAGPDLVALAPANRFSAAAAAAGRRLGWCGVRVGTLDLAAAAHDDVHLVCAATGEVLVRWSAAAILLDAARTAPAWQPVRTVPELRRALRQATACEDAATAIPFARHFLRLRGEMALVAACYRWILGRVPAPVEAQALLDVLPRDDLVARCFQAMLGSQEYLGSPRLLANPFDGQFPFGLGALDE